MGAYLLIVFSAATAGFYQNEALCTLYIFLAQCTTLSMFDGKVIGGAINKFKGRKNLG